MRSFWKTRSRKSRSSRPNSFLSILKTRNVALKETNEGKISFVTSDGGYETRRERTKREREG